MDLAKEFFDLFSGLDRAHGQFEITGPSKSGKISGKASTKQGVVTDDLWRKHLSGEKGLGIVPIRDDNNVLFAAIDIDDYKVDIEGWSHKYKDIPFLLCRTKSGGVHVYFFFDQPIAAAVVRGKLIEIAIDLGYPGVEIFPKQEHLAGKEDVGNWINMPYFHWTTTDRYCLFAGEKLTAWRFLDLAKTRKLNEEEFLGIQLHGEDGQEFADAPPCLQVLTRIGFPQGSKNNALFDMAVYAKKKFGSGDFKSYVHSYNVRFMSPGTHQEVEGIIKSLAKKEYFYRCKEPPINQFCNKHICRKRMFGMTGDQDDGVFVDISGLQKILTDPPIWYVTVNGKRIKLDSQSLLNQRLFALKCIDSINVYPKKMSEDRWRVTIEKLLIEREEVEAPIDAGSAGRLIQYIEQFCTTRAQARTRTELLMGKPWKEGGKTYFRSADLARYLEQQRFREFKLHEIWDILRTVATHHQFNVRGKNIQCWAVPDFPEQTEPFDVPRKQEEEQF